MLFLNSNTLVPLVNKIQYRFSLKYYKNEKSAITLVMSFDNNYVKLLTKIYVSRRIYPN